MGIILLVLIVLLLAGGGWGYSSGWVAGPYNLIWILLVLLLVFAIFGGPYWHAW